MTTGESSGIPLSGNISAPVIDAKSTSMLGSVFILGGDTYDGDPMQADMQLTG